MNASEPIRLEVDLVPAERLMFNDNSRKLLNVVENNAQKNGDFT